MTDDKNALKHAGLTSECEYNSEVDLPIQQN